MKYHNIKGEECHRFKIEKVFFVKLDLAGFGIKRLKCAFLNEIRHPAKSSKSDICACGNVHNRFIFVSFCDRASPCFLLGTFKHGSLSCSPLGGIAPRHTGWGALV